MSVLSLNKISYSYKNGKNILDDISIEFEKGKFYTILGVSGSGKTTLLSLLAGLDEPRKGEVLYNNEDIKIKGYENHRKNNISLIFQNYNLIDYMTPLENLRIICHNCDATLPTYKGRNKINKKEKTIDNNKEKKLLEIKDKIIKSNIDFSKKTWGVEVAKLINKSPQWSLQFVKENLPHLIIKNKKTETRK